MSRLFPMTPTHFVLLSIQVAARRDDFVGQVGNLRPIVNRPLGITHKCQHPFAACRYAVQVANLRPIGNRPVATPNVFSIGCRGLSTVQLAFSRLFPRAQESH